MNEEEKIIELNRLKLKKLTLESDIQSLRESIKADDIVGIKSRHGLSHKDILGIALILLIISLISIGIYKGSTSTNKTTYHSTTQSTTQKKCSWCNKEFIGYGWYHLMNTCNQQTSSSIEGNLCSFKCCSESSKAH